MMATAKILICYLATVGLMFLQILPAQPMNYWFRFTQAHLGLPMASTSTFMRIRITVSNGLITKKAPSSHQHFLMRKQTNLIACG